MSMYGEQDLYKFLERIALALEKLAIAPVTGFPPVDLSPIKAPEFPQKTTGGLHGTYGKPKVVVPVVTVPNPITEPASK